MQKKDAHPSTRLACVYDTPNSEAPRRFSVRKLQSPSKPHPGRPNVGQNPRLSATRTRSGNPSRFKCSIIARIAVAGSSQGWTVRRSTESWDFEPKMPSEHLDWAAWLGLPADLPVVAKSPRRPDLPFLLQLRPGATSRYTTCSCSYCDRSLRP